MRVLLVAAAAAWTIGCGGTQESPPEALQNVTQAVIPSDWAAISGGTASASANDGNVPSNVLDNDYTTRWSCDGVGCWVKIDYGTSQTLCGAGVAWYQGTTRINHYVVATSTDNVNWTTLKSGDSAGNTTTLEPYSGSARSARYLRVTVNGNTVNTWASILELRGYSSCGGGNAVIGVNSYAFTGWNVARGTDQLVGYNAGGTRTGTNPYGTEVAIDSTCTITAKEVQMGNMLIPAGGAVISGHGNARVWLTNHANVGGQFSSIPGMNCGGSTPPPGGAFTSMMLGLSGLTHYYPLTSAYGVEDLKGTRDGTNHGASIGSTGATFTGSNSIELGDHNDFSISTTGQLTVLAFMTVNDWAGANPEDGSSADPYIHWMGKGSSSQHEWVFRHYTATASTRSKRISAYAFNPGGGLGAGSYFQESISTGTETMVAATFDDYTTSGCTDTSTAYPGVVRIYRDGVLKDCDGFDGDYNINPQNGSAPFRLGTRDLGSHFKGKIRRVAVFNRKLSAAELANIWSNRASAD